MEIEAQFVALDREVLSELKLAFHEQNAPNADSNSPYSTLAAVIAPQTFEAQLQKQIDAGRIQMLPQAKITAFCGLTSQVSSTTWTPVGEAKKPVDETETDEENWPRGIIGLKTSVGFRVSPIHNFDDSVTFSMDASLFALRAEAMVRLQENEILFVRMSAPDAKRQFVMIVRTKIIGRARNLPGPVSLKNPPFVDEAIRRAAR